MNSWKRSFGEATGAGAGARPGAGALMAGLPRQTGGIVERRGWSGELRAETEKKREDLPCLPNGLAEPLGESF